MTGKELKALREKLGFTQKEMGEKLGISHEAVYSLECGRNRMSRPVEMLAQILKEDSRERA